MHSTRTPTFWCYKRVRGSDLTFSSSWLRPPLLCSLFHNTFSRSQFSLSLSLFTQLICYADLLLFHFVLFFYAIYFSQTPPPSLRNGSDWTLVFLFICCSWCCQTLFYSGAAKTVAEIYIYIYIYIFFLGFSAEDWVSDLWALMLLSVWFLIKLEKIEKKREESEVFVFRNEN